jgi:hypothetical protein
MPCHVSIDDAGTTTITCTRGRRRVPCGVEGCPRDRTRLCDFPVAPVTFGERVQTCDLPLCDVHATRVSRDQDHCPAHAAAAGIR